LIDKTPPICYKGLEGNVQARMGTDARLLALFFGKGGGEGPQNLRRGGRAARIAVHLIPAYRQRVSDVAGKTEPGEQL
jgi:hypothetical protein